MGCRKHWCVTKQLPQYRSRMLPYSDYDGDTWSMESSFTRNFVLCEDWNKKCSWDSVLCEDWNKKCSWDCFQFIGFQLIYWLCITRNIYQIISSNLPKNYVKFWGYYSVRDGSRTKWHAVLWDTVPYKVACRVVRDSPIQSGVSCC